MSQFDKQIVSILYGARSRSPPTVFAGSFDCFHGRHLVGSFTPWRLVVPWWGLPDGTYYRRVRLAAVGAFVASTSSSFFSSLPPAARDPFFRRHRCREKERERMWGREKKLRQVWGPAAWRRWASRARRLNSSTKCEECVRRAAYVEPREKQGCSGMTGSDGLPDLKGRRDAVKVFMPGTGATFTISTHRRRAKRRCKTSLATSFRSVL